MFNFQLTVGSQAKSVLTAAIVDGAASRTLYQAVAALSNLGLDSKFTAVVPLMGLAKQIDVACCKHKYFFCNNLYDYIKFRNLYTEQTR